MQLLTFLVAWATSFVIGLVGYFLIEWSFDLNLLLPRAITASLALGFFAALFHTVSAILKKEI